MARKKTSAQAAVRNLLHDHPLLRKGGVHDKTTKAKRRLSKMALRRGEPYTLNAFTMECAEAMRFTVQAARLGWFSPVFSRGAPLAR